MSGGLYWQVEGEGPDVILIHGWGMNGAVWETTIQALATEYRVHVVDLPGYGYSHDVNAESLEKIAELLLNEAPEKAVWVGWSLGGLVATYVALHHPDRVSKLVTVSSSPKFAAEEGWRGIKPVVLDDFTRQLRDDFQLTIERFMALQTMGSPTAKHDVQQLKRSVLSRPVPDSEALMMGLSLLAGVDLRAGLSRIHPPFLRLYGRLDGLVPVNIAKELDSEIPNSVSHIFRQSSHAPFITEPDEFILTLKQFVVG